MAEAISNADFLQQLADCDFMDDAKMDLITGRHTNMKFNERVRERHLGCCDGYGFFSEFFGTETWEDGQGQDEIREMYFHPSIAYSFQYFTRTMQICDPKLANECNTEYCDIPEGGYGNLPPIEMYKWGFKTPRSCVANIRYIRQFREWAKRVIDTRFHVDQQVMQMFYTFAALRMTGHKIVLEATQDANGNLVAFPNSNPRNPLGAWKYNFMQPLFPSVDNPANIVPLTLDILQQLARRWTHFCNDQFVAIGPRGDKIWEFWYPADWYEEEVLRDAEHLERLKYFMPTKLFAGYSMDPRGEREVVGNWAMRPMPCLPRFAESCDGGLVPIDMHQNVRVEIGNEAVESRDWLNAPFLLAGSVNPSMGVIMTRPVLSTSAEGWPILPIMGNGDWIIRNDYDSACNADLNQPFSQKRYEMGFRLDDPYSSIMFIFRARKYRTRAINTCELADVIKVDPVNPCDNLLTIGCQDNEKKAPAAVTEVDTAKQVLCSNEWCGPEDAGEKVYRLDIEREGLVADFDSLGCACNSTVIVNIHDDVGALVRQQEGVVVEVLTPPYTPSYKVWIRTATLEAGECIKSIVCQDDTPTVGNSLNCWVSDPDDACDDFVGVKFLLDSPLSEDGGGICGVGDTVDVEYFDSAGNSLGIISATIAEFSINTLIYRLTSEDEDFSCTGGFTGVVSITITCTEGEPE
jgi:hypothetical protein